MEVLNYLLCIAGQVCQYLVGNTSEIVRYQELSPKQVRGQR